MGEKLHPTLALCLFMSLFPHFQCELETTGFSLKLIQRDIFDTNDAYFPDMIRALMTRRRLLFTIDVTIGTPRRQRSLLFDPGSHLIWTQCMPCTHCFKQASPLFDPNKSSSYKKLPSNHALAKFFTCTINGGCVFNTSYLSGQSAAGIASTETFTLQSNKNVPQESINKVVFGCTNNFQGQFSSTLVAGILGMNRSPLSFINQIKGQRFSYCLPRLDSSINSTFLRFGNDIKEGRINFKKTSFIRGTNDYSIKLRNISVAGRVLSVPNTAFSKGCVLDMGSAVSRLEMAAHVPLLLSLQKYFDRFNLTRVKSKEGDLCYLLKPGFKKYPGLTFHFEGGDLEIEPENLFRFSGDGFCLALFGTPSLTILGAYQQQNVRFVYDIGNEKLLFAKEDCSKDISSH